MDRFDKFPKQAEKLFPKEIVLCSYAEVGLYEANTRLVQYDNGGVKLTNYRILWQDAKSYLSLSLSLVADVQYVKGFLQSHSKVCIFLHPKERLSKFYSSELWSNHSDDLKSGGRW